MKTEPTPKGIPLTEGDKTRIFPAMAVKHKKTGTIIFANPPGFLKQPKEELAEWLVLDMEDMTWKEFKDVY